MADPRRELIAQALLVRLKLITKGSGYYTDGGKHVSRRPLAIQEVESPDLPCLYLFSGERPQAEALVGQGGTHHMGPVEFIVLGYVEGEEPDRDLNLLEADVLKALLGDETLATTGITFPAGCVVQVLEAGSVTDFGKYATTKRGFLEAHFTVTNRWTHASP